MAYPIEAYAAIDQLNSWIRSESRREWWTPPTHAIYDWKNELIKVAIRNGEAELETIYLTLTCRDCGGRKCYTDSYGYRWPHCRRCSSTGVTRLEFLVSSVHGFKWHTPRDKTWQFSLAEGIWNTASLSTDWEPNQRGKNLKNWEVAALLNYIEPILPKPGSHGVYDHGDFCGEVKHSAYKMSLGRSDEICQICGRVPDKESDGSWYRVIRQHAEWSAWGCNVCRALYAHSNIWSDAHGKYIPFGGNGKSIFEDFPVPPVTHPELVKWFERRSLIK